MDLLPRLVVHGPSGPILVDPWAAGYGTLMIGGQAVTYDVQLGMAHGYNGLGGIVLHLPTGDTYIPLLGMGATGTTIMGMSYEWVYGEGALPPGLVSLGSLGSGALVVIGLLVAFIFLRRRG